ncbi:MAG TPA: hypothetical protein VFN05_16890 [Actinomycetes bacterium]|nr:hypothetical protein [Actinomycetes bacterium]
MIQVGRGMGLGRVLGIPLRLDLSWAVGGRALAAVLVAGGAGAALWQWTPRWMPQVVLGLFLWQAAIQGERAAWRSELLAGRAERG